MVESWTKPESSVSGREEGEKLNLMSEERCESKEVGYVREDATIVL